MSLVKLTVLSFNSGGGADLLTQPSQQYTAMFNPSSYKIDYQIKYQEQRSNGSSQGNAEPAALPAPTSTPVSEKVATPTNNSGGPSGEEPRKMSFDFLIDGTGASGTKRDVFLDVETFKKTVGYRKNLSPTATDEDNLLPFLLLVWGTFIFQCKIESISVNFTLFDTFGIPLRATMSCTFREFPGVLGNMGSPFASTRTTSQFASVGSVAELIAGAANMSAGMINKAKDMDLNSLRQPL